LVPAKKANPGTVVGAIRANYRANKNQPVRNSKDASKEVGSTPAKRLSKDRLPQHNMGNN
jgi:hypothetical protein